MKFVMSYSGGKDSALALYRMLEEGHIPAALLTTVNRERERSWFHGLPEALLQAVAAVPGGAGVRSAAGWIPGED